MSIDTHIKFDSIKGEAAHKDHKDEIEVLSWSWSVANESRISGGGSGKGKAIPGEFSFTHLYDRASPTLAKKCLQGVHFPSVVLTARKSGEGQQDFLKVTLKEVFITAVHPHGAQGGDVVEGVQMSYGSIDFDYKQQTEKGSPGESVTVAWNVKTTEVA